MLVYTVEAALGSKLFDRIIVSTDDPEIAEVAKASGAEVPFLRNAKLADNYAPVSLATIDALERVDPSGLLMESVAQLMPNCPLRTAKDLRDSYAQFRESGTVSQISVTQFGWQNPWWALRRASNFELTPLFPEQNTQRSQDLPDLFCPTGAVWWAKAEALRKGGTFHLPGRTGWEIAWPRGIDIDTSQDWQMAELLMRVPPAE